MKNTRSSSGRPTFLVPFDFASQSWAALETAAGLAAPLHADLQLLHVVQPRPDQLARTPTTPLEEHAESTARREDCAQDLAVIARQIEERVARVGLEVVEGLRPDLEICEYADRIGADMIVMGTHGRRSRLSHLPLGSVAERTLCTAPCPVLSVNAAATSEDGSIADSLGADEPEPLHFPLASEEEVGRREGLLP
jgi:nucleotide-binding universal stress UspA family protein